MHRTRFLPCLVLALFLSAPATLARAESEAIEAEARTRLASIFMRSAARIVDVETLQPDEVRAALVLGRQAVAIDPGRAELWRRLRALARIGEDDELVARAIREVARLDPRDERARLERITLALDERYQTIEERLEAYGWLIDGSGDGLGLGEAVRSRLALDLALLRQRTGDLEGFGTALAESLALDPANRTAAGIAAGFFQVHAADAAEEAELLINLLLADPTDPMVQVRLGSLLLENGAFVGAERCYRMAIASIEAARSVPDHGLAADFAIAQWANGNSRGALATIRQQQLLVDRVALSQMREANPELELDPVERARVRGMLPPVLLALRVAIPWVEGDLAAAEAAREEAIQVYRDALAGRIAEVPDDPDVRGQFRLRAAWMLLAFGGDVDEALAFVDEADATKSLTDDAQARFRGWAAVRRGDPERAIGLLTGPAARDGSASLGLAISLIEAGRDAEGDGQLLETFIRQPGTIVGLVAMRALQSRLGRPLAPGAAVRRLEDLMRSVPSPIDRYASAPSLALEIRIVAPKTTFAPLEPIELVLELMNNSPFPLAVDASGPVRPQVVVMVESSFGRRGLRQELPPFVIDLDRHLRLPPRSRIRVPIDLALTQVGGALDAFAFGGGFLRAKAWLNPIAIDSMHFRPGPLGDDDTSKTLRVNGIELGAGWIEQAIIAADRAETVEDLLMTGLLAQIVVQPESATATEAEREVLAIAQQALSRAFDAASPPVRAWLVSIMPTGRILAEVREAIVASDDELVRIAWLNTHLGALDDPVLVAALAEPADSPLRRLGEVGRARIVAAERAAAPVGGPAGTGPARP